MRKPDKQSKTLIYRPVLWNNKAMPSAAGHSAFFYPNEAVFPPPRTYPDGIPTFREQEEGGGVLTTRRRNPANSKTGKAKTGTKTNTGADRGRDKKR